ncbi:methyltransferase [Paenibacillus ihbetae]|uniref:Methyltransferase n=1 Tax=Paenibacillus ihbetae TaxID=1870820 RepID=A0ABX3JPN2_9BACL|nr:methyltransferase [Paenibacillus ihbetae]OOC58795.1 methyltransferase [Paenibacillus ihbetae]
MNIFDIQKEVKGSDREAAGLSLLEQTLDFIYPATLRAAALLGVADHLVNGPKTVGELAQATETDELRLYRALRLLASRGVFRENESGQFELTPSAEFLCTDAPLSLRSAVLMITDETFWRPSADIVWGIRGVPPFKRNFGMPFFDYWAQEGASSDDFHVGMSSMSEIENEFLARSYDFPDGATVADIAGGFGGLLLRILRRNPTLHGILFDRPHVLPRNRLGELGADDRWELAPGNFFESVPKADIYVLKYIMHDWHDEEAVRILRCCREAMAPGGRVLVMDPVIPPGNTPHTGKILDLINMTIYEEGRERTEEELRLLFAEAGLRLTRIIDTGFYISIVEAVAD